jgi:hypothetical protein
MPFCAKLLADTCRKEYIESMTELYIGALLALIVAVLFVLLLRKGPEEGWKQNKKSIKPKKHEPLPNGKSCPLCSAELLQGQTVKSVLYPKSPGSPDRLMEIHGCPYCYPAPGSKKRLCPVCKQMVPLDGNVIARVFEKPERRHVHVLGCSSCYRRK